MLEIDSVRFEYAEASAMEFTLGVKPGEVLSIIGPSGAGKSTLISLIAGFLQPLAGDIKLDGTSILSVPIAERPVSMVFQQFNLFPHLDVFANVALGISTHLKPSDEQRQRIDRVLDDLDLKGLEHRKPGQLSGGQQQRVALARAMLRNRRLLLLDEAFTALGPSMRSELLKLVKQLVADHNMMAISISHQPDDAELISERLAFIDNGQVIEAGPVNDLLQNPQSKAISDYLGSQA